MPIPQELLERIARNEYREQTLNLAGQIGGEEEDCILSERDITNLISALNKNTHIKHLSLVGCFMSSELIARLISSVIFLQGIAICTMEDEALSTLPTNEMLKELSVTGMINHTGIEYIVRTRQLRKLSLFLDRIDDRDIELIGQHQPLEELTIANSWVKDSGVVLLAKNTTLKALALSYNQITDEGVKSLSENTNLISLSLAHNKLTDSCVPYLTKMRSLVELNVSKNALTVSGVKMLYESGIREIDASSTMQKRMLTFSFDAMRQRTLHAGPDLDNPAQFGRVSGADLVAYYSEIRTRLGV